MRFESTRAFFLLTLLWALQACSSGDTDALRQAVFINEQEISRLEIRLPEDERILDINEAQTLTLQLVAIRADSSEFELSRYVQWSSSAPQSVSVNGVGEVGAIANGSSVITASLADLSASIQLSASDAVLESITPAISNATVPVCSFENTLSATGRYSDDTERNISKRVTWSSDDSSVARVIKSGLVSTVLALRGGEVKLRAQLGSEISPDLALTIAPGTVSGITIAPLSATVEAGRALDFVATATYNTGATRNITRASVWTSTNPAALAVNSETKGRFNAVAEGNTVVKATCDNKEGSATAIVTKPVTVTGIEIRDQNRNATNLINKDPNAPEFQLFAYLKYSNGTELDVTDRTDDPYNKIIWSIDSSTPANVLTLSNQPGTRGRVRMLGVDNGQAVIKVSLQGETDTITIDSDFDHP